MTIQQRKKMIVSAIEFWADTEGGIPPTCDQWKAARATGDARAGVCSVPTVVRVFGSWNAAVRAAGFEPHTHGWAPRLTNEQRAACVQRYAAGKSSVVIGAQLGVSPDTVVAHARRAGIEIRAIGRGAR